MMEVVVMGQKRVGLQEKCLQLEAEEVVAQRLEKLVLQLE
jgi:hypothetical protein